ncbi:MAG: FAD-dependent oxidoreductase [Gemmatimonadaceae bacterium]
MRLHTGSPFWPIRDGLPSVFPALDASTNCEFVVLGGGITGAILAHRLATLGRDVVLLDKREVAAGSTSATTALIQYELDIPATQIARRLGDKTAVEIHHATRRAVNDIVELSKIAGESGAVVRRPSIKFASSKRDIRGLHADFTWRQQRRFDVQWLSADELATSYGLARPAAITSTDNAECDPYAFTHALLRECVRLGARVYDRVPVRDIMLGTDWGDDVIITTDDGHVVRARSVVAATGYESSEWLPKRPATLRNTYALVSEPFFDASTPPWPDRALIWETAHPYLYMRTTDDGRVLVGGEDDRFRNPVARDRRIERKSKRLIEKVTDLLPHVSIDVAYSWGGTFGETTDALPRIGPVDGCPNLFVAACYGGNGITFSMLAADMLEARVKGEAHVLAECMRCDR